jgi:hypothetical protein
MNILDFPIKSLHLDIPRITFYIRELGYEIGLKSTPKIWKKISSLK